MSEIKFNEYKLNFNLDDGKQIEIFYLGPNKISYFKKIYTYKINNKNYLINPVKIDNSDGFTFIGKSMINGIYIEIYNIDENNDFQDTSGIATTVFDQKTYIHDTNKKVYLKFLYSFYGGNDNINYSKAYALNFRNGDKVEIVQLSNEFENNKVISWNSSRQIKTSTIENLILALKACNTNFNITYRLYLLSLPPNINRDTIISLVSIADNNAIASSDINGNCALLPFVQNYFIKYNSVFDYRIPINILNDGYRYKLSEILFLYQEANSSWLPLNTEENIIKLAKEIISKKFEYSIDNFRLNFDGEDWELICEIKNGQIIYGIDDSINYVYRISDKSNIADLESLLQGVFNTQFLFPKSIPEPELLKLQLNFNTIYSNKFAKRPLYRKIDDNTFENYDRYKYDEFIFYILNTKDDIDVSQWTNIIQPLNFKYSSDLENNYTMEKIIKNNYEKEIQYEYQNIPIGTLYQRNKDRSFYLQNIISKKMIITDSYKNSILDSNENIDGKIDTKLFSFADQLEFPNYLSLKNGDYRGKAGVRISNKTDVLQFGYVEEFMGEFLKYKNPNEKEFSIQPKQVVEEKNPILEPIIPPINPSESKIVEEPKEPKISEEPKKPEENEDKGEGEEEEVKPKIEKQERILEYIESETITYPNKLPYEGVKSYGVKTDFQSAFDQTPISFNPFGKRKTKQPSILKYKPGNIQNNNENNNEESKFRSVFSKTPISFK
jgi:hypothetical protein